MPVVCPVTLLDDRSVAGRSRRRRRRLRASSKSPEPRPASARTAPVGPRARLVLNALALQAEGCGVQCYARELLGALGEMSAVDGDFRADLEAVVDPAVRGEVPETVGTRGRPARHTLGRVGSGVGPFRGADLVHGLDVQLPAFATGKTATVATVHDLAVFDVPWSFSRRYALLQRMILTQSMRRADAVIADSAFTAERIRARFRRDATVIALAAPCHMAPPEPEAVERVRGAYGLPARFVLYVGRVEARKDVGVLAAACAGVGVPLVIAGRGAQGATLPGPGGVVHVGYVAGADLPALYGAATVVGYPSLYEGFGLPPLEAMACGTPVVAYRIPPLVETLAGAADLVPTRDEGALGVALRRLVSDGAYRHEQVEAGLERARRWTWQDTARATVEVYRDLGIAC